MNLYQEKFLFYIKKIQECIQKYEVSYKKSFSKDSNCVFSEDYPYKTFWVDYLKLRRKTFCKNEFINESSFFDNEKTASSKFSEFKMITNDLATIFEEFELIENLIELMVIQIIFYI